jgi:hypothetical protein
MMVDELFQRRLWKNKQEIDSVMSQTEEINRELDLLRVALADPDEKTDESTNGTVVQLRRDGNDRHVPD